MTFVAEQIKEQLGRFAQQYGPSVIMPAIVTAVNEDDTVSVQFLEGGVIDDCRLKSIVKGGDKFVLVPVVGSVVLIARVDNSDEYYVCAVHEITDFICAIDNTTFKQSGKGFQISKGSDSIREALELIIESVQAVVVVQGSNPDRVKLQQALIIVKNLFVNAT